nr:MAG TPA: hypothetical protein [Caudoviricetes sp.]
MKFSKSSKNRVDFPEKFAPTVRSSQKKHIPKEATPVCMAMFLL